jgi:predicted nucleic acid-binding Zn ribbon protein
MLPISSPLQKIAADLLRAAAPDEAPLLAWPIACGASVSERTRAISFVDGLLTIAAADKAWCTQLDSFSDSYLQKLNSLSPAKISRLRFIIEKEMPEQSRQ